jgi:hypothetical protein
MDTTRMFHDRHGVNGNSRDIERDIERTRSEMDETLEQIGERLSPRHLLDELLDLFRSDEGDARTGADRRRAYMHQAQQAGRMAAAKMKQHPVPTLLCAAGLAWLIFEQATEDEGSDSSFRKLRKWSAGHEPSARAGDSGGESMHGAEDELEPEWSGVAAWHVAYDWSKARESEDSWAARADRTIQEASSILNNPNLSAADRIKLVAAKITSLSGRTRREVHSRWRNLREHSGSFVDARTGEPYSENYGRELEALMACDYAVSHDWSRSDQAEASSTIESLKSILSDSAANAREKLQRAASHLREVVGASDTGAEYRASLRSKAGEWMHRIRSGASGMSHGVASAYESGKHRLQRGWGAGRDQLRRGYENLGEGYAQAREAVRHGYESSREGLQHGYEAGRDQIQMAMREHPLATGAACLGLGLIAGLLIPESARENRLMGRSAKDLRSRARRTGAELMERGQRVAEAAVSAGREELEKAGVSADSMADAVEKGMSEAVQRGKEVARASLTAAEDKMRQEGLTGATGSHQHSSAGPEGTTSSTTGFKEKEVQRPAGNQMGPSC